MARLLTLTRDTQPKPVSDRGLFDYARFGVLAGPLTEPAAGVPRVSYRRPPRVRRLRQTAGSAAVLMIQTAFFLWLLLPGHLPLLHSSPVVAAGSVVMLVSVYLIQLFCLVNVGSLCLAGALAKDPVPIVPEEGTRVAFLTTIVPSREPISVVRPTLEAARRVRHQGVLDVWLLDEGDDRGVRSMCAKLGVRHFSRRGVKRWNAPHGPFKAKTKHGNYNAWLDQHGDDYDFFVSVDPDHVPLPSFCERLLGYFRDPNVAFVVGPQVYGNFDNFVTKCAESQQFVFHGLLQRMGNSFRSPMLVGTNNAVRISAMRAVGGLQDSITEDMATSLSFHSQRNSRTGQRWQSVYTPDVLAVGEGPANFTDFFTQQHRWSRGTTETLRGHYWRCFPGLSWGARLHYALLMAYYPSAALGWILGIVTCSLYLLTGSAGIQVPPHVWVALYVDLAVVQFCLYASNRRLNVSPHEAAGSSGAAGMFISALSAPVYVSALAGTLARSKSSFVVTPKGASSSVDGLRTFRWHLAWGAVMAIALGASVWLHHPALSMRLWSLTLVGLCLTPATIALVRRLTAAQSRRQLPAPPAEHRMPAAVTRGQPSLLIDSEAA